MRKYVSTGALILLGVLVVQGGPLFKAKLSLSSLFGDVLGAGFDNAEDLKRRVDVLEDENESLRIQLLGKENDAVRSIKVYSSYPFSSRSELAIAAGESQGIKSGEAVVHSGTILVGQVKSVLKSSSVVTTIFDPSWEMAVRIGDSEVDALMSGGNELSISLIPQDALVEEGDTVISADKNFPYGLELGYIKELHNTEGDVFQEAALEPTLKLKTLRDVTVYR